MGRDEISDEDCEMRHRGHARPRSASPSTDALPAEIIADSVRESALLSRELAILIAQAETAGLSIIAKHLGRALALAERVAASGQSTRP